MGGDNLTTQGLLFAQPCKGRVTLAWPLTSFPAALSGITFLPGLFGSCGRGGLLVPLGHRLVEKLVDRVDDVGPHQGEAAETPVSKLNNMCL